jgi:hypothetical protein
MSVIIGVDPHKATHTAVAIDRSEAELARAKVRATRRQVPQLLGWAEPLGERTWAVESAGGLGYFRSAAPATAKPQPLQEPQAPSCPLARQVRAARGHLVPPALPPPARHHDRMRRLGVDQDVRRIRRDAFDLDHPGLPLRCPACESAGRGGLEAVVIDHASSLVRRCRARHGDSRINSDATTRRPFGPRNGMCLRSITRTGQTTTQRLQPGRGLNSSRTT